MAHTGDPPVLPSLLEIPTDSQPISALIATTFAYKKKELCSHKGSVCVCVRTSNVCSILLNMPLIGWFPLQPWKWGMVSSNLIGCRP